MTEFDPNRRSFIAGAAMTAATAVLPNTVLAQAQPKKGAAPPKAAATPATPPPPPQQNLVSFDNEMGRFSVDPSLSITVPNIAGSADPIYFRIAGHLTLPGQVQPVRTFAAQLKFDKPQDVQSGNGTTSVLFGSLAFELDSAGRAKGLSGEEKRQAEIIGKSLKGFVLARTANLNDPLFNYDPAKRAAIGASSNDNTADIWARDAFTYGSRHYQVRAAISNKHGDKNARRIYMTPDLGQSFLITAPRPDPVYTVTNGVVAFQDGTKINGAPYSSMTPEQKRPIEDLVRTLDAELMKAPTLAQTQAQVKTTPLPEPAPLPGAIAPQGFGTTTPATPQNPPRRGILDLFAPRQ